MIFGTHERNLWLDALLAAAIGLVGQLIIELGLRLQAGLSGPLLDLIAPVLVGVTAGVLSRRGSSVAALAVGVVLAFQIAPIISSLAMADTVGIALSATAAAVGFAAAHGSMQQQRATMAFQPAPADLARLEAQLDADLRGLDPNAPGTFERAVALLRQAGEQTMFMGWPGAQADPARRAELLRIQGELVEVARLAAVAAGATRVTVSSTPNGIDIQAIWGEPPIFESPPGQVPPGPYEG